ncbi:MAG: mechanosensitive ion channel family protein [Acidobacteriota bacterium]
MTPAERKIPLFVQRVAGPLAILAATFLVVLLMRSFGYPAAAARPGHDWGSVAVGIAGALLLTRLLDYLSFDVAFRLRKKMAAPALLRQLVALIIFLLIVAAVAKILLPDFHLGALLTGSAILTAILGLALQDTLGNLFAGLALHLEKTMRVGDMVRSGETFGTVEELSWREIRLRTMEGNLLLIPNSVAGRERVEVFARPGPPIARWVRVGLEYDASPATAREALQSGLREMRGLARHPAPWAGIRSFEASSVVYELRYWLEDYADYLSIDAQVRERIWYSLRRANLPLAWPVIRQLQYQGGPIVAPDRAAGVRAAIEGVDLFAPLSDDQRQRLAAGARERRYAPDEIVVREGDETSSMFVVASGRAGVSIHGAGGDSRKLAILEPGKAFGEISLLTGEPRTATVRSLVETVLLEIDKKTLEPILRESPTLCGAFQTIIEERRRGAADVLESSREELGRVQQRVALADRIARFFGLG